MDSNMVIVQMGEKRVLAMKDGRKMQLLPKMIRSNAEIIDKIA